MLHQRAGQDKLWILRHTEEESRVALGWALQSTPALGEMSKAMLKGHLGESNEGTLKTEEFGGGGSLQIILQ